MKKLLLLAALCARTLLATPGSVTVNTSQLGLTDNWVVTFTWVGDSSTGAVPTTIASGLSCCQGYTITQVSVRPGTPSPTPAYDVAISDFNGYDVLAGSGNNLSATLPTSLSVSSAATPLNGSLSLAISGQSVASARGTISVFLAKQQVINVPVANSIGGVVVLTPSFITLGNGTNQDVSVSGASSAQISGPSGAFSVGGIAAAAPGAILFLINSTSQIMTLNHLDAGSQASNRIFIPGAANFSCAHGFCGVELYYTGSQWLALIPGTT